MFTIFKLSAIYIYNRERIFYININILTSFSFWLFFLLFFLLYQSNIGFICDIFSILQYFQWDRMFSPSRLASFQVIDVFSLWFHFCFCFCFSCHILYIIIGFLFRLIFGLFRVPKFLIFGEFIYLYIFQKKRREKKSQGIEIFLFA